MNGLALIKKQIPSCVLNLSQSDFFVPHKTFSLFNILIVCLHVRQLLFPISGLHDLLHSH